MAGLRSLLLLLTVVNSLRVPWLTCRSVVSLFRLFIIGSSLVVLGAF
jgi:hypothetical protein